MLSFLGFICIAHNGFIGLIMFTVMLYIKPVFFSPMLASFHITRLVGIITIVAFLIQAKRRNESVTFGGKQTRWLLALIICMILSSTTSIWRGNTFNTFLIFLRIVIAYFLVINLIKFR